MIATKYRTSHKIIGLLFSHNLNIK